MKNGRSFRCSFRRPKIWFLFALALIALTALTALSPVTPQAAPDTPQFWTFDTEAAGTLPGDFVIGTLYDGRPAGEWKVIQAHNAPNPPHVQAQLMGKGAEHAYKVVLIMASTSSDLDLEVSLLPVEGKADMGGGLIWHAVDDRNYYLTRANPLEQNIRINRVVKGVRQMLKNFDQIIDVRSWHTLRVVMRGCQVNVFFDEKQVFELCDETFKEGLIGLWTKSDAVTYFDNLRLKRS